MVNLKRGAQKCLEHYRKAANPKFTMNVNDQQASALLQCPPEVRLMIFKMLLYDDHPLEDVRFSTQLLRTCQVLYHEGKDILYGSNTLLLKITPSKDRREMLDLEIPAMKIDISIGGQYCDSFHRSESQANVEYESEWESLQPLPIFDDITSRLVTYCEWVRGNQWLLRSMAPRKYGPFFQRYATLELFDKYRLDVVRSEYVNARIDLARIFFGLRMLQELLRHKNIVLDVTQSYHHMKAIEYMNYLRVCCVLRCKSVDFRFSDTVGCNVTSSTDLNLFSERVKTSIEWHEPFFDSWQQTLDLRYELFEALNTITPNIQSTEFQSQVHDAFIPLHCNAIFYSKAIFQNVALSALQHIEFQLFECFQDEIDSKSEYGRMVQTFVEHVQNYLRARIAFYDREEGSSKVSPRNLDLCHDCGWMSMLLDSKHVLQNCRSGCVM